jgi:hypothetical protein
LEKTTMVKITLKGKITSIQTKQNPPHFHIKPEQYDQSVKCYYHRLHRCLKVGDTITLSGTIGDMTQPRRKPGQNQPPPRVKTFYMASIIKLQEKPAPTAKTRQTKGGTPKPHPMWAFLEALVTSKCQVITISRTNPPALRVIGFTNSNHQQQEAAF